MEINDKRHAYSGLDDGAFIEPKVDESPQVRTLALVEELRAEVLKLKTDKELLQTENDLVTTALDILLDMETKVTVDKCTPQEKHWFMQGWGLAFEQVKRIHQAYKSVRSMTQQEIDTMLELRDNTRAATEIQPGKVKL